MPPEMRVQSIEPQSFQDDLDQTLNVPLSPRNQPWDASYGRSFKKRDKSKVESKADKSNSSKVGSTKLRNFQFS